MVRWRARNDAQLHYFSRSTPSSTGTSTKEEHPLAASYSEASQSWPVHVRDRLARALWPRARAGCGAWCFVARLDVVVQMLAKAVPDTVERALPEPSPFAHDESTCPPSSKSGHDSSACVCRHDKRGFTTTPRGRLMGCRACWLAAARRAAMVQLSSGSASRLYRVAGMPLWRRGCASASVCSDVPLAEIIAVGLVCDDLLLVRQRKWWVTACS